MATIIQLGNLTIADIEKELGIIFDKDDKLYLEKTHQNNISQKLQPENWHFYDMPHRIDFGSYKAFDTFKKLLDKYDIDKQIQLGFLNEDVKLENLFDMIDEKSGLPRYLVRTTYKATSKFIDRSLLVLTKVNKKTAIYSIIAYNGLERLYEDKLGYEGISILSDPYVPKDNMETYSERKFKVDDLVNRDMNNNILVSVDKSIISDKTDEMDYTVYTPWNKKTMWTVSPKRGFLSDFEVLLSDNKSHLKAKKLDKR